MISRRLSALALCLLAFAGCHEDPTVISVEVAASVQALALLASGGAASSSSGVDGVGGQGGNFLLTASGLVSLGSASFVPSAPATPALPTAFASIPVSPVPSSSNVGSILLAGNLTTTNTATVILQSSNGDIVVSGDLQSGDTGAAQTNLQLLAPNGTVYVTGRIRTAGVDAALNGRSGGSVTISARRVVLSGTLDTHGVANTTVAAANGGDGGNVDIVSTQGPISFVGGSIDTRGGACVDSAANNSIRGGNGGFVHLNSATAVNSIHVFAPIATDGGAMTGNGTTPQGGNAGDVSMRGLGDVNIVATISTLGGTATGNNMDAVGGNGGAFNIDGAAAVRIYGTLVLGGGIAFAAVTGGTVTGGIGGTVGIGQLVRVDSVELGSGSFSMAGGSGQNTGGVGGGAGGAVAIESFDGDVTIGASFSVAGGAGAGSGNAGGGAGGTVRIQTDAQAAGNLSNHLLSIPSLATQVDARGGTGLLAGAGGAGGSVVLQCGGDLTCGARILVSGGNSGTGAGGAPIVVVPAVAGMAAGSSIVLRIFGANLTATGTMTVTGELTARGGEGTSGGSGGSGAGISLLVTGSGSLVSSATLNTMGATASVGAGGTPGQALLLTATGDLALSGTVTTTGSNSPTSPKSGGALTVRSGGALTNIALLNAAGGAATDPAGLINGATGGAVLFDATSPFGGIFLNSGSFVTAEGGASSGSAVTTLGGAGGSITLQSRGQAISMSGSLVVRGGAATGLGTGGLGGLVVANSDVLASGTAGSITLHSDGGIDAGGGSGSVGGAARRSGANPGAALTDPPVNLAVVFDANNGLLATAGANPGKVINNGSISATGGSGGVFGVGGDVWFNGLNSSGVAVGALDGGNQNRSGSSAGLFYPH